MRGFTLTEIVTAIAIMLVVMVAVSLFQYNVLNSNSSGTVALTNSQDVQAMIRTMVKEIRSMESGSDGAYPIVAAATSSLIFFADIDSDGNKEKVRYYVGTTTTTANNVYRGVIKPTGSPAVYNASSESKKILMTGVRNASTTSLFEYYDGMYAGTSTPMAYPLTITSIRLIRITMTFDTDPNKAPAQRTFTTQVGLRNLKDNL